MPRKFQDNQPVRVHYASRRMHFSFFGIVEKYSGGVYHVRYLAGEKATDADMVFACRVGELCLLRMNVWKHISLTSRTGTIESCQR